MDGWMVYVLNGQNGYKRKDVENHKIEENTN